MEWQSCRKRHTKTAVAENCLKLSKNGWPARAGMSSTAELLKRLTEKKLLDIYIQILRTVTCLSFSK